MGKNDNLFGYILAGIAALIAGAVGLNELSKSKSSIKDSAPSSGYFPPPKKSGCGCSG